MRNCRKDFRRAKRRTRIISSAFYYRCHCNNNHCDVNLVFSNQSLQKENREFYASALDELERGNQIARDIRESVDYIRYWK